ncbi:hypothetical protein HYW82_00605 [Candidatus Peregrinibacteria bacterium]|nr:hypothetical protein [Candidatus Peregrinibacteria bacterium]
MAVARAFSGSKLTKTAVDEFGNDFDKTKDGFIDFLLLDEKGVSYVVLETKSEDKDMQDIKEDFEYSDQALDGMLTQEQQRNTGRQ